MSDPLPPSAALPLTEGENKALTLQAYSPLREGETRAKRARGSITHHLELQLSNMRLDFRSSEVSANGDPSTMAVRICAIHRRWL